jgi:hypothetical protein
MELYVVNELNPNYMIAIPNFDLQYLLNNQGLNIF